ncbi:MAG: hypothetical protein ACFCUT_21100 [Kiloniellaceae bacterium]
MATTRKAQVQALVQEELASFEATAPTPGSTIGMPWSTDRLCAQVAELKAALVIPYLQRFELRDTAAEMAASPPILAGYWVVASADGFLLFYDPEAAQFGLACALANGALPQTIGVRGDLVGTFCAR